MPDVHDRATRSRNMAAIGGKNSKPEMQVRSELHKRGFRFRLHDKTLPGKPDLVLPRYKAVVFVNGCFWHGHACHLFRLPGTRTEFWRAKINANQLRDDKNAAALVAAEWRVANIWECALKGKTKLCPDLLFSSLEKWLKNSAETSFSSDRFQ